MKIYRERFLRYKGREMDLQKRIYGKTGKQAKQIEENSAEADTSRNRTKDKTKDMYGVMGHTVVCSSIVGCLLVEGDELFVVYCECECVGVAFSCACCACV